VISLFVFPGAGDDASCGRRPRIHSSADGVNRH